MVAATSAASRIVGLQDPATPRRRDAATPRGGVTGIGVGCAGWSIPSVHRGLFAAEGSRLERYATRFACTEINSSFYRPHRYETYARWAASVPRGFRFSVKLPRSISHDARLRGTGPLLDAFLAQCGGLGARLGCLLLQLPPSLVLEPRVAATFLAMLRRRWDGPVACEPRHASWFGTRANALWLRYRIARVAADPSPHAGGDLPGGDPALAYWRWHGSPRVYYSAYGDAWLAEQAARVARHRATHRYVVFDNTAHGHAVADAARFMALLRR